MTNPAKIAITIPPEDLEAADRLAARLGRGVADARRGC